MNLIRRFLASTGVAACVIGSGSACVPQDDGVQLRSQIEGAADGSTITLPKREYHLFSNTSPKMNFYVSNHDQQRDIPVGLPFVKKKNVTLDACGSTLVFRTVVE